MATGTSHFASKRAAIRYYQPYGFDAPEIDRKIAENEINIGKPALKPGQRLVEIDTIVDPD